MKILIYPLIDEKTLKFFIDNSNSLLYLIGEIS